MPITVFATLRVHAGQEGSFRDAALRLVEHVRTAEPGTLKYVFHQGKGDPTRFGFYEVYVDQAALETHSGSAAMMEFLGSIGGTVDGQPEIVVYEELAGKS